MANTLSFDLAIFFDSNQRIAISGRECARPSCPSKAQEKQRQWREYPSFNPHRRVTHLGDASGSCLSWKSPLGRCQQRRHAVAWGVLRCSTQYSPQRGRDRACWHTPRTYALARGEVATAFQVRRCAGAPPFTRSSSGRAKQGFPQRVRARLWQNEVRKRIRTTAQPFPRCVVCHPRYPRTTCYSAFCVPIGGTNSRTYRA